MVVFIAKKELVKTEIDNKPETEKNFYNCSLFPAILQTKAFNKV